MVEPGPPDEPPTAPADPLADAFRREELTALIGEAEAARLRRGRLQVWSLAVGLAALCLGLPGERLWGDMELVRLTAGNGGISYGILFPLAVLLKNVGPTAEQVCLVISAACYGLCLPAMMRLLRTIGFGHGVSLFATSISLFSAAVWLGATQPADFAPGILGATLLLETLFQTRERIPNGYQWRATLLLALAFLLRPENMLVFPAVAWAVSRHRGLGRMTGPFAGFNLALVTGFTLWILMAGAPGGQSQWRHLLDTVLAGREPALVGLFEWAVFFTLGLGLGWFGIYSLLFGRRLPEETPAPKWMVPWCLVALAPAVGGRVWAGPAGAFLIPAAAIGLADWLTRRFREEDALRWGTYLLAAQLLATSILAAAWQLSDPLWGWRINARARLEPSDVAWVSDPDRAYLLARRWGLRTVLDDEAARPELDPELERQVAAGRRRLVWVAPASSLPRRGAVLHPDLNVWVLTEDDLVEVPAGQAYER